ncbi:hypothetical protein OPIT5_00075 (plasmid) [Opitutaceae bacterium TAV5]|nr:hypothetical protein OPIT5_00075 [Opitutaceae bacterium TAV5]
MSAKKRSEPKKNQTLVVRLDEALAEKIDRLQIEMVRHGVKRGYSATNIMMLAYFAVMRWTKVTRSDVKELLEQGEATLAGFRESMKQRGSGTKRKGERPARDSRVLPVPRYADIYERLFVLEGQFYELGARPGRFFVNNFNIIRQALRRWDSVTQDDAEGFIKFLARLRERKNKEST